ncbi:MAG: TIGR01777 family oxidoreductase [Mariniphaga sp.]
MKIAIAGSTGFIGKQLSDYLLKTDHELIVISRGDFAAGRNHLSKIINSADVIINLAGASVLQRWNNRNKKLILSSRVDTTRLLVEAVLESNSTNSIKVFINASAIGIYQNSGVHDEFLSALGSNFLAAVCKAWEAETVSLGATDLRLCTIRIGVVLGTSGGSLGKMLPLFKIGIGGKIASGRQAFSFIHIMDFCRAIDHLISNNESSGIYNLVAPEPATNQLFTNTLAAFLHRPAILKVPAFALKLLYGEASEMLTEGATVIPSRLMKEGFQFRFPSIPAALEDLVQK